MVWSFVTGTAERVYSCCQLGKLHGYPMVGRSCYKENQLMFLSTYFLPQSHLKFIIISLQPLLVKAFPHDHHRHTCSHLDRIVPHHSPKSSTESHTRSPPGSKLCRKATQAIRSASRTEESLQNHYRREQHYYRCVPTAGNSSHSLSV